MAKTAARTPLDRLRLNGEVAYWRHYPRGMWNVKAADTAAPTLALQRSCPGVSLPPLYSQGRAIHRVRGVVS